MHNRNMNNANQTNVDFIAINSALTRYENLLSEDFSDSELYRLSTEISLSMVQDRMQSLTDDFARFVQTIESLELTVALQQRISCCRQQIAEKNKLLIRDMAEFVKVLQQEKANSRLHGVRKIIITNDRADLAQALQNSNPETYFIVDKVRDKETNYQPVNFYQLSDKTVCYDVSLQNTMSEQEYQRQQALTHELVYLDKTSLVDTVQQNKPFYIYGDKTTAKQIAQRLYLTVPHEKRAQVKIFVNDVCEMHGVDFWKRSAKHSTKSSTNFRIEKAKNLADWRRRHKDTFYFGEV